MWRAHTQPSPMHLSNWHANFWLKRNQQMRAWPEPILSGQADGSTIHQELGRQIPQAFHDNHAPTAHRAYHL